MLLRALKAWHYSKLGKYSPVPLKTLICLLPLLHLLVSCVCSFGDQLLLDYQVLTFEAALGLSARSPATLGGEDHGDEKEGGCCKGN